MGLRGRCMAIIPSARFLPLGRRLFPITLPVVGHGGPGRTAKSPQACLGGALWPAWLSEALRILFIYFFPLYFAAASFFFSWCKKGLWLGLPSARAVAASGGRGAGWQQETRGCGEMMHGLWWANGAAGRCGAWPLLGGGGGGI